MNRTKDRTAMGRMRACVRRTLLLTLTSLTMLCFTSASHAQITVGAGGTSATETFDSLPPATRWSTFSISGGAGDFEGGNDPVVAAGQLDTAVRNVAPSSITAQLNETTGNPPGTLATARWSSTGMYVQTRPTGNGATLMMATLRNDSAGHIGTIVINYDYAQRITSATASEVIQGNRVYYNLTGAASGWVPLGNFGARTPVGAIQPISILVNFVGSSWAPGSPLYVLFVDDNSSPNDDWANSIDNFRIAPPAPIVITQQPTGATIEENRPASFIVAVTGTAPQFQWYTGTAASGTAIPDATNRTFGITRAQISDSGNYFVVITGPLNTVTSSIVTLTVTADTTAPAIASVSSVGGNTVGVCFNEEMEATTTSEGLSYTVRSGGATVGVSGPAVLRAGNRSVLLTLSSPISGTFTVSADGPVDLKGNPINASVVVTGSVINLTSADLGSPLSPGSAFSCDPAQIEILAGGADIWGTADAGHIAFAERTGDFNVSVRVAGLTRSDNISKAGIMVRETTAAGSRNLYINSNPPDGRDQVELGTRRATDGATDSWGSTFIPGGIPNLWLRVQRFNDTFLGFRSTNGVDWILMGTSTQDYPDSVLLGLAATAHNDAAPPTLATFRNFREFQYPGSSITINQQPPSSVTIPENNSRTLTIGATAVNAPQSELLYQWQTEATIGAGDYTNIFNANSGSLVVGPVTFGDNGRRFRVVLNLAGITATSAVTTVTVGVDTFKPIVSDVRGLQSLNGIKITFNEPMEAGSTGEATNYRITDTNGTVLNITNLTLSPDGTMVTLKVDTAQVPGSVYTVRIEGPTDLVGNILDTTNVTARAWVITRGFVLFEAYNTGAGNAVMALTSHPSFPNDPTERIYISSFDSRVAYPNDSHEAYGARISGFFNAPATTNYIFYMRSDDAGELRMNTNAVNSTDPAGAVKIQEETGCCGVFSARPATNSLVGGTSYYIELLYKEGTGGDYGQVAFKFHGDPFNPDNLSPIPSRFLGALADPVGASVTIVQQPASISREVGTNATFTVQATGTTASGPGPLAYQWQRLVGGAFVDIAGANNASYTTPILTAADTGSQFRVLVFTPGASATSAVATLTIGAAQPTLRFSRTGNVLTLSWDAGARLQVATRLSPANWQDVDTGGATSHTVDPANQFDVNLDSAQENNPANMSPATGSGTVTLSGNTLRVDVTFSGLTGNLTADHFHVPAARGAIANPVYDLASITTGTRSGTIRGTVTLTDGAYAGKTIAQQVQDLRNSLWYLNIHTTTFGGGEIRGQVEPASARFYRLVSP